MAVVTQIEMATAPVGLQFAALGDGRHSGLVLAGDRRKLYRPDARIDACIREAYRRLRKDGDRTATRWAQRETGWPKYMINRRAAVLGLARAKEGVWVPAEIDVLQEYGHLGAQAIQRKLAADGFHRTRTAVMLKRKRLQLTARHLEYAATIPLRCARLCTRVHGVPSPGGPAGRRPRSPRQRCPGSSLRYSPGAPQ